MDTADHGLAAPKLPRPHRITTSNYYRLAEAGILDADSRVELIDGQIFDMAPIGPRHHLVVDELTRLFIQRVGLQTAIRAQGPVRLDEHHAPQPDLALFRRPWAAYPNDHPGPADIHLLIEVSDTTLAIDSRLKAELYARFAIPEYWIVDLTKEVVLVHREPIDGTYASRHTAGRNERITASVLPCVSMTLAKIFEQPIRGKSFLIPISKRTAFCVWV